MNVLGWVRRAGYSERRCGRQSVNPRAIIARSKQNLACGKVKSVSLDAGYNF
jgi:hypothetical protein